MAIGLCGTNALQRVFGQQKIEGLFFALARLRRRCFADAAVLVGMALLKPEIPYIPHDVDYPAHLGSTPQFRPDLRCKACGTF